MNADSVLVIDNNTVIRQGPPKEIIPDLMKNYKLLTNSNEIEDENVIERDGSFDSKAFKLDINKKSEFKDEENLNIKENDEEEKEQGFINFEVYRYYCVSIGILLVTLVFLVMIFTQGKC